MSDNNKGFFGKLIGVMTCPRETLNGIEEGDLWRGVAIVLIATVLSSWAGLIYFTKMDVGLLGLDAGLERRSPMFNPGAQGYGGLDPETLKRRLTPFVALGSGLGVLTRWLVPSVLLVFGAKILMGEGGSKRMLTMTGFTSAPRLIQQILRVVDAYTINATGISSIYAVRSFEGLTGWLLNQALTVFNLFGVLTIALTCIAVSVNYDSPTRKAALVTLLSYAVYVLLRLYLPII